MLLQSVTHVSIISWFLLATRALYARLALIFVKSSAMLIFKPSAVQSSSSSFSPSEVADVSSAPWPGPGSGASPFVSERSRSFLLASMTLIFERRVANLTNRGRGGEGEPSDDGLGLPTRWDTDISSTKSGGTSFILELQRRNTLSSVDPLVSSDMPKMRTESRRPCCSWSSMAVFRWLTSCCKF